MTISATAQTTPVVDVSQFSIDTLAGAEITSASRKEQRLFEAAAAVFVISQEDIRRSGANSIPEVLRLVPGIDVAQMDANKWAITARGFNERFADKMLILIDGRAVISPLSSGVYWDVQDTVLEDIDRIEVIRGPGMRIAAVRSRSLTTCQTLSDKAAILPFACLRRPPSPRQLTKPHRKRH